MSKFTTPTEVRLSYTNLLEPREDLEGNLRYSSAILIPKSDTALVDGIKKAIKEALEDGISKKWGGKTPKNLKNPLRDGDEDREDDPVYKGHYFINAKGPRGGKEQPILLNSAGDETDSTSEIYSGVHARVSLQFYAYDMGVNRGVGCSIASVLSSGKGDPLTATLTVSGARDDFGIATPAGNAAKEFADATSSADADADADEGDSDDPWAS